MTESKFKIEEDQLTIRKIFWYHLYMGIPITITYIFLSKLIVLNYELPGLVALLLVEIFVLAPIVFIHLLRKGKTLNGKYSLRNVISYTNELSFRQYAIYLLLGVFLCLLSYIPLYPLGLWIKENLFHWLPEWYFNPSYGTTNMNLIARAFLFAIVVDGLIGPTLEELFFRAYLLPRMTYLKTWAPILNGVLFGLYHFWQPHNFLATSIVGVIISVIVWKKKNVYLGIMIHCTLNVAGALASYIAANGGHLIPR